MSDNELLIFCYKTLTDLEHVLYKRKVLKYDELKALEMVRHLLRNEYEKEKSK